MYFIIFKTFLGKTMYVSKKNNFFFANTIKPL